MTKDTSRFTLRLPRAYDQKIQEIARKYYKSRTSIITEAIGEYLARKYDCTIDELFAGEQKGG